MQIAERVFLKIIRKDTKLFRATAAAAAAGSVCLSVCLSSFFVQQQQQGLSVSVCLAFSSSSSRDCLSVCLFVLFVYLSAFDFFVVQQSSRLSVCLSVCLTFSYSSSSDCLSVYLHVSLFYLSVCLSAAAAAVYVNPPFSAPLSLLLRKCTYGDRRETRLFGGFVDVDVLPHYVHDL